MSGERGDGNSAWLVVGKWPNGERRCEFVHWNVKSRHGLRLTDWLWTKFDAQKTEKRHWGFKNYHWQISLLFCWILVWMCEWKKTQQTLLVCVCVCVYIYGNCSAYKKVKTYSHHWKRVRIKRRKQGHRTKKALMFVMKIQCQAPFCSKLSARKRQGKRNAIIEVLGKFIPLKLKSKSVNNANKKPNPSVIQTLCVKKRAIVNVN